MSHFFGVAQCIFPSPLVRKKLGGEQQVPQNEVHFVDPKTGP